MRCCYFRPDLELTVDPTGWLRLATLDGEFVMVGNTASTAQAAADGVLVQPHCTHVVRAPAELEPIRSALLFEAQFARLVGKVTPLEGRRDVVPKESSNDWHDDSRSSHSTSGARRHFVSVGFERYLRGIADGLESIRSWARYQRNRPVAWWPFVFKYDGYFGKLASQGWKYDDRMLDGVRDNVNGWAVVDPAHVETSILFAGAAAGDLECLGHLILGLAPWVASTWPAGGPKAFRVQKGWRGSDQERAVGRVLKALGDCALLGIGIGPDCAEYRDTFLAGLDCKQHVVGLLRDLEARWPPFGSGKADERTAVDFKDGSGEVAAWYPWQRSGIMFHDVGRVLRSGLVNDPLRSSIRGRLEADATTCIDQAIGPAGVSYAVSRNRHFTQSSDLPLTDPRNQSVDKANAIETDKSHVYELDDDDGDGVDVLRDRPRRADAELTAAGVAMVRGADDPAVRQLLGLLPKPGATTYTGSLGRSLDVAYALLEASG